MSQELVGSCGAIVGSSDYFHRLNQGAIFAPYMMSDGYQYTTAVGQLCSRCVTVIDEIYSDVQSISSAFRELPSENRENLLKLIDNLEEAANFMFPTYTSADSCRSDLISDREKVGYGGIDSIWGDDIGSSGYMQSKCSPIFSSMLSNPLDSIVQTIASDLNNIASQIAVDLDLGVSSHFYMRDENGDAIRGAIQELERCNCSALSFYSTKVSQLCWYRDTPKDKVLELQKALNKISGSGMLTEDGVYGEKTSTVWHEFIDTITNGSVPILGFIDPLQSQKTGITVGATKAGAQAGLKNALMIGNHPYIRFDPSHNGRAGYFRGQKTEIDFNHINLDPLKNAPGIYNWIQGRYNHYALSDDAYNILKNLEKSGKVVRIAGRVLLVAGAALNALEIGTAINSDLNDADGKLGKVTVSTVASIGGSWAGAFGGAKLGALAGTLAGPAAPIAIPVLGIAGGILGSLSGEAAAEWIVDITCLEE